MQIDSNHIVSNIEQHFKVSAGPGAGKTHWLVQHIKNVLHNSNRLGKTGKIACITYTNVAVETILDRLGNYSDHVEVSTIHSFLYKHIVKPYAVFVADEYGLNIEKMDGHDDTILSNYTFLEEWKKKTRQFTISEYDVVHDAFSNLKWKYDSNMDLICKTDRPFKAGKYSIKNNSYFEYKLMTWERGIIHHDDVLFFSHKIVHRFPFVLEVLRAKFPYFFLDEFQDSNPIQVDIIKKIGERGTTIGIIGDIAQSIYGFQGADPSQFSNFTLNEMQSFEMTQNRRSTNEIINVLNLVRKDLVQISYRSKKGELPKILCGDRIAAYAKAQEYSLSGDVVTLSRNNITANAMKQHYNGGQLNNKLFNELHTQDTNIGRRLVISSCVKGVELARERKFKDAIKELMAIYKKDIRDKEDRKKKALNDLHFLMERYEEFKGMSLLGFHLFLKRERFSNISNISKGSAKTFYESHNYQDMALCVHVPENLSSHRTIHNAKGDEFNNVLLILNEENDLNLLHSSDLQNEEHRIAYVALSRAKERLFISVPSIDEKKKTEIESVFSIENV